MREQTLIQCSEQLVNIVQNRPSRPQVQIEDNRPSSLLQAKMVAQLKAIAETAPPAITDMTMGTHAFKHKGEKETEAALAAHGLDFTDTTLLPFIQTARVKQNGNFNDVFLKDDSKRPDKSLYLGYTESAGKVVMEHVGPFGVAKTAQL